METVSLEQGNINLLALAYRIDQSNFYDQTMVFRPMTGSPSCALGFTLDMLHEQVGRSRRQAVLIAAGGPTEYAMTIYCLNVEEAGYLFSSSGCGRAGTDGKKAATYIRQFVANRREANRENVLPLPTRHPVYFSFDAMQAIQDIDLRMNTRQLEAA